MGYAIVDKSKNRDPPLPPPRTPPRRRRSIKSISSTTSSEKFSTVPRSSRDPPTRPLRNYSTLGQVRSSRKTSPRSESEKENVDITQYIEIEDDLNRNLVSGEVIQKMKDRPLPAPPRPPRKARALKDITSQQNIPSAVEDSEKTTMLDEADVSTQTEPLPDDFVCEEILHPEESRVVQQEVQRSEDDDVRRERVLITPTQYSYEEETITHGTMVVEPLNGARILPDSELTKRNERIVPVTVDSDDEYPSKVPEEFKMLRDPEPQKPPRESTQRDSRDLEVNRLMVNELLASKIVVSDIEADSIQTNQISGKSGAIKIGEIELPPNVLQELIRTAQVVRSEEERFETVPEVDKKKLHDIIDDRQTEEVPVEEEPVEIPAPESPILLEENLNVDVEVVDQFVPPEDDHSIPAEAPESITDVESERNIPPTPPPRSIEVQEEQQQQQQEEEQPPVRPPRQNKPVETTSEPDVDDYPPPRPPQPTVGYIPSQPPASFYALRAQKYVNEDIPAAPRRRRHHRHVSKSTSEESLVPLRRHFRSEPSIAQLTGQLMRACGAAGNSALKRLIAHVRENVLRNEDGQQDLHVIVVILLVLIAGLLLLGLGDERSVVHHHHWEYFNPPRDT